MCCSDDIGARVMDSMVYHIGCCVQQSALSTVDDFAFIIDKDEIGRLDQAESNTEWVDPKCCRIYRVLYGLSISYACYVLCLPST